jgi:hypothetical protein
MDAIFLINLIGWTGSAAVLLAYGLVSARRVQSDSVAYQVLNMVGSVCLLSNTIYWGAYPSSFVNIVWTGIALFALMGVARRRAS